MFVAGLRIWDLGDAGAEGRLSWIHQLAASSTSLGVSLDSIFVLGVGIVHLHAEPTHHRPQAARET